MTHRTEFPESLNFEVFYETIAGREVMLVPEFKLPMQFSCPQKGSITELQFKKQVLQDVLNEIQHTLENWIDWLQ